MLELRTACLCLSPMSLQLSSCWTHRSGPWANEPGSCLESFSRNHPWPSSKTQLVKSAVALLVFNLREKLYFVKDFRQKSMVIKFSKKLIDRFIFSENNWHPFLWVLYSPVRGLSCSRSFLLQLDSG